MPPDPSSEKKDLSRLKIERESPSRRAASGWGPFWLLVLALLLYVGYDQLGSSRSDVPEVELASVLRTGPATAAGVAANGYVVARTRAAISTDMQGRLVELCVQEGDHVREGDLLARLDTRQLEASLARTRADIERQRARAKLARLHLDRTAKLASSGDASASEVDSAQAELEEAEAQVRSTTAGAQEIQVMIDKSSIYAPFSGVVILKNAEVGEVVAATGAGGNNSRGAVATLVDFNTLEVQVELSQTSLSVARVGAAVDIFLDAYPDDRYPGRVRQIWPTADRQKATVELRVEFLVPDDRILPDMGVRVVFRGEEEPVDETERILLPRRALVASGDEKPYVFLFRSGTVQRRAIHLTGEEWKGRMAVESGLVGQELVVLDPPVSLRDGDRVRQKKEGR